MDIIPRDDVIRPPAPIPLPQRLHRWGVRVLAYSVVTLVVFPLLCPLAWLTGHVVKRRMIRAGGHPSQALAQTAELIGLLGTGWVVFAPPFFGYLSLLRK